MFYFHVLLTYGAKPEGSLRDHPEAKPQLDAFQPVRAMGTNEKSKILSDYVRSIRRLEDLPKMLDLLKKMKKAKAGAIFVDDLSRYFNRTSPTDRSALLEQLSDYGEHIFSCGNRKRLVNFTGDERKMLLMIPDLRRNKLKQNVERDTSKARQASIRSRSNRSVAIGLKIQCLREELLDAHNNVTLQMVADKANESGMLTATGKQWTRKTVGKALEAAQRSETE